MNRLLFVILFLCSTPSVAEGMRIAPVIGLSPFIGLGAAHAGVALRTDTSDWLLRVYGSVDNYGSNDAGSNGANVSADLMWKVFKSNNALGFGLHHRREGFKAGLDGGDAVLVQKIDWVGAKLFFGGCKPLSTWCLFTYDFIGYVVPVTDVTTQEVRFDPGSYSDAEARNRLEAKIDKDHKGVPVIPGFMFGLEF